MIQTETEIWRPEERIKLRRKSSMSKLQEKNSLSHEVSG